MSKFLFSLVDVVTENIQFVEENLVDLSKEEFSRKPNPDSWCVAEVLNHLLNSERLYIEKFEKILELNSPSSNSKEDFKRNISSSYIEKMFGINGPKMPAPKAFRPMLKDLYETSIISEFIQHEKILIDILGKLENYDLNKIKISSPVNSLIKFKLGNALLLVVLHQKRHFEQIKRILNPIK